MESVPATAVELYLPLILSLACLFAIFRTRGGEKRILIRLKPFGDFVDFHIQLSNVFVVRSLLLLGSLVAFSAYFFYDYSRFLPQRFQMEVFYDEQGLAQSLGVFSQSEIRSLSIPLDAGQYKEQYFKQLDDEIRRIFGEKEFFSVKEGHAHSSGQAYTVAEKVRGWQNYYVSESHGELTHVLEMPDRPAKQFYTRFEKLASKDDYINLTLSDLFIRRRVVLRTEYKQILIETKMSEGLLFKVSLVGVTRLSVFPWPRVSNTVYLVEVKNAGLVPIAYAIYR